jgi:hypothetical protein
LLASASKIRIKNKEEERVNKSQPTFVDNRAISNAAPRRRIAPSLKNLHHRFMESCPPTTTTKKKVAHPFTIASWNRAHLRQQQKKKVDHPFMES